MTTTRVGGTPKRFRTFRPSTFQYQDSTSAIFHFKFNEADFPAIDYGAMGADQSYGAATVSLGHPGAPGLGTSLGLIDGRALTFGSSASGTSIGAGEDVAISAILKVQPNEEHASNENTALAAAVSGTASIGLGYYYPSYIALQMQDDAGNKLYVDYFNVVRQIDFGKWVQVAIVCDKSSAELPKLFLNRVQFQGVLNPDSTVALFSDVGTMTFAAGTTVYNGNVIAEAVTPMYLAESWLSKGLSYRQN